MNEEKIGILTNALKKDFKDVRLKKTHISWVILAGDFAYKIKKPVKLSFLDYSTLQKRMHCCRKEVELNSRLASNMYLDVEQVSENGDSIRFGGGNVIDYAVKMKRVDESRQMDELIRKEKVSSGDIKNIAEVLFAFHQKAAPIRKAISAEKLKSQFNDILSIRQKVDNMMGASWAEIISRAVDYSDRFISRNLLYFMERQDQGCYRDCHGDLHSGNIFLTPKPVVFDCIEFNDDFRQIDILDETAFFCMDMDYHEKPDFGRFFFREYLNLAEQESDERLEKLFNYYKCYRANVRAKVIGLNKDLNTRQIEQIKAYLKLIERYKTQPVR